MKRQKKKKKNANVETDSTKKKAEEINYTFVKTRS